MKGIIIKDFYESFCLRKNMIGMIFAFICLIVMVFAWKNLYSLVLTVVIVIPMIGCCTLQYSLEQDEICKYDQRLLSFPITRKEIVQAKIMSTVILSLLANMLFSLPVTLTYALLFHIVDLQTALRIWVVGLVISFIMTPINNIGFFLLGNKRGTIFYMIFLIIVALSYVFVHLAIGINELLLISKNIWLIIGIMAAFLLNIIGYLACVKIYTVKHS